MDKVLEKPNILWICTDQQRYDTVHCLGNESIRTPNIDCLCREVTAFTRTYCQSPVCTPSRASFLTGLYPSSIHINTNGNMYFPENVRLITKSLSDIGYDCGLAGKLHLASAYHGEERRTDDGYRVFEYSHSPHQGIGKGNRYTQWIEEQGYRLDEVFRVCGKDADGNNIYAYPEDIPVNLHQSYWCVQKAIDFITQERKSPWLFSLNIFDPHPPYDAPDSYRNRYDPGSIPPPLFNENDLENQEKLAGAYFQSKAARPDAKMLEKKASYYGMIELIDEQLGRLLEVLDKTGQRENTLIIYTSDHGDLIGDHGLVQKGCRFYEGAVRVPLIISWKGKLIEGQICNELAELTDIAPTLADICGLDLGRVHGKSLLPKLVGEKSKGKHRDFVRCEYYAALPYGKVKDIEQTSNYATMYRDDRYKLIVYHGISYGELYDLEKDPKEFKNLWENHDYLKLKAELLKKSYDASMLICDPGPPIIGKY